jgi:hypothetical protein
MVDGGSTAIGSTAAGSQSIRHRKILFCMKGFSIGSISPTSFTILRPLHSHKPYAVLLLICLLPIWFRDTFGLSLYKDIKDFEWGIAAWPHPAQSQFPTHLGSWVANYYALKGAPNPPETSWEFLKALVSPEGQRIWVIAAGNISIRRSLGPEWINNMKTLLPKQSDQLGVITDANTISYVTPDGWAVNFSKVSDIINSAVQKAVVENGSATDIINEIKPKVEQTIADELKSLGYSG